MNLKRDLIVASLLFCIVYIYINYRLSKKKYFSHFNKSSFGIEDIKAQDVELYNKWKAYAKLQKEKGDAQLAEQIRKQYEEAQANKNKWSVISGIVTVASSFIPGVGALVAPLASFAINKYADSEIQKDLAPIETNTAIYQNS